MQVNFDASPEANLYFDRYFNCNAVKILPGEFYATSNDHLIVTVLGSCIATCLFDPANNVRGMNHFLLPRDDTEKSILISESARYGTYAMELLINEMLKLGAKKNQIVAKVFGGGNVMKGLIHNNIGQRNVDFAFEYLKKESIPVVASDVLSDYPRKVYFFEEDGLVRIKKIKALHNTTILDRESEYRVRLKNATIDNPVDLF
ncbi:chemoreceptor glutamine deamidase CheD [Alteromonas gracilis]|uniref:chemoreceptor glutamine deamidase CheD n=1 Tax=Alteromonas gracilis TaxID=1479524 RepID=UPI003D64B4A7